MFRSVHSYQLAMRAGWNGQLSDSASLSLDLHAPVQTPFCRTENEDMQDI